MELPYNLDDEAPANELERLFQELSELVRDRYSAYCYYDGLLYKSPEQYIDKFRLGTICWYMRVYYQGYCPILIARTPEEVLQQAIEFFKKEFKP